MEHPRTRRIASWRASLSLVSVVALMLGVALSAGIAVARADHSTGAAGPADVSPDTIAKATGGGTVMVPLNVVASFGINGKRPPNFTGGGFAQGRINYDRHAITPEGRHVNVPVSLMEADTASGKATLAGDCNALGAECSHGARSVLAYVEDNGEPGTNDVFRIFFCDVAPFLPGPFDGITPPVGCFLGEGGMLRSGDIQVRP